jgi:hypothetical protein
MTTAGLCTVSQAGGSGYLHGVQGNGSKRPREVMDNARGLSMGEMRNSCDEEGIELSTAAPYHAASSGAARCAKGSLLTRREMLHDSGHLRRSTGGVRPQ